MSKRTMPICFTEAEFKRISEFAKKHGMLNASQAVEKMIDEN